MTKARAKYVLNVNDEERVTTGNVHKAFRKASYPLELENSRQRNHEGFTQGINNE